MIERTRLDNLGGAKEVDQAQKQSSDNSAASQGAEKAKQAMSTGKQDEAAREANKNFLL